MKDINQRIARLSPEKRALVERYLMDQDRAAAREQMIPRRESSEHVPLSFAQQRLWLLDQFEPGSVVYNMPAAFHLEGALDIMALEKSLNEIIQRHEGLRTTFSAVEGEPVQKILPRLLLKLQLTDLQELPESEREKELRRLADQEARRPFDIAKGPLLRAGLLRLDENNHVLLLTVHHIVSDGWSKGVLFHELSTLYKSFSAEELSPLPDLPIQYADFAVWQRQWLQGEILENQLSYWREQLDGALPVLELPADRPRPAVQAYRGRRHRLQIPLSLVQTLKALSRQEKTTLFMLLLTAFKILLSRYTAQKDIIVGSPIANRNRSEIEGLIGFFINTLVLRTDLSDNPTIRELLARVREVCYGAYNHQDLPFEKLVEELQPERSLSHSPLFQVMFVLQNTPRSLPELPGLKLNTLEVDSGTAKFDLTLNIFEEAEELSGEWEYDIDLFDTATIERMAMHYQTILEGIVTDPEQLISDVPLLTADERHLLLVEWNDTKTDYPRNKCFHQLFEEQVLTTSSKIAVEFEDEQISYNELNRKANQLAHYLRDNGVGPNVLVGLFVDRSIDMMVGLLGILKAGGAYVPLDPDYPKERLSYMLEESTSPVLITQSKFSSHLPESNAQVIFIDSGWESISQMRSENPVFESEQPRPGPEDLAYVIFTSGSTGKPKGVKIPHRAVTNFLLTMSHKPGVRADDILLAVTTLSFDIHVLELYTPLIVGGKVVIASRETAIDGRQLAEVIANSGITIMQATPSTWRLMIAAGWQGAKQLNAFCGGEAFPRDLVAPMLDRVRGLWNLYGPTETTVYSTGYQLQDGDAPILIGRPVANTQTYVLDAELQPVPVGVPGELYIGGDGVTHGYLNRPDLTREAFIPDPFLTKSGAFLYKTGDLVKYRTDGNIDYLNRLDNQIKLRGFRIELGEIEAVISVYPAIKQTITGVKEFGPGDQRLICYYKEHEGKAIDLHALRSHLRKKLPEYMVPQHFMELEEFPLTPAGKIDRKSLIARQWQNSTQEENYTAPQDTLELQLTEIWEKVLHRTPIGTRDNFFELGGHSLLATQVISRVINTFGVNISLRSFFQAPTVADIAVMITQKKVEKADSKDIDRLLNQLESLSDEEAQHILGKKST
jgi:amino acid adenylation domain-containing protein